MKNDDGQPGGSGAGALEGTVLAGRYTVARVVSTGANTVIVDAIDGRNDGQVTLKIVRPEHAQDPEFRHKFHRLAEISNALTHPNIASVTDWGEIELRGESTVFWVVDALGGGSLRDLLDRGRLLAPGQALVVGLETCRALDAAHQKGLFHTELTPSKMVFGADRRLRVVDFGMARLLAEPAWADAAAVPTHVARYASPEQALGLPIDASTDIYALALVMIEAVTGSVPFSADSTVATLSARVDKLLPVSADLGSLASVLERAGRPEASERFTAAEFGRALVQAAPGLPKPEPIPILSTGAFDTTAMRRPTDPTGGVERPAPVPDLANVDEAGVAEAPSAADDDRGGAALAGGAVVAGGAAAATAAGSAGADAPGTPPAPTPSSDAEPEPQAEPEPEPEPEAQAEPESEPEPEPEAPARSDVASEPEPQPEVAADGANEPSAAIDSEPELPETQAIAEGPPDDVAAGEPTVAAVPTPVPPSESDLQSQPEPLPRPEPQTGAGLADTTVTPTTVADLDAEPGGDLYDEEARPRRRLPIVLLVIVLLAGLGALGYAASLLFQTKSFEVPALAGVPEDEALNQIAGNGWEIDTLRERSDTFPELNTVIRTVPGPGTELEEGSAFTLVLSDGPEFRTLPELVGLPFDAAFAQLAGLGLNGVEGPERLFSETVEVESVISWQVQGDADATMQAGAQILPGETIVMTLSKGPEPRTVPDLAGQTAEAATEVLDGLQLQFARGDDVFSDTVPVGQIVSQSPAAGQALDRDGTVTVQISKGPDVVAFPDLDGLNFTDAQALLIETGFVVGSLLGSTDGTFVEATIDGADVLPGDLHRRGTAVDVIFL